MTENSLSKRVLTIQKIWDLLGDNQLPIDECSLFNIILFKEDKLFDSCDWKSALEKKKDRFREQLEFAPKSSGKYIYHAEMLSCDSTYNPEEYFSLKSLAYDWASTGRNWTIEILLDNYPVLEDSSSDYFHFEKVKLPNTHHINSCYRLKRTSENELIDGISQAFYKDYLIDIRKEFYPEEFDSAKMEKFETKNESNITWDGSKLELCELIKALYESKRVKMNGKLIQQKDLILLFENFFNEDLRSFHDSLRDAKSTNKWNDGKTFMNELSTYINIFKDKLR